jgi:SH3-like domain-containing protein
MQYAACQVSIAPMRAHPSDKSEMVSQLLFGEAVEIQDSKDTWRMVSCAWDGYAGWVDAKQLTPLSEEEFTLWVHDGCDLSEEEFTSRALSANS